MPECGAPEGPPGTYGCCVTTSDTGEWYSVVMAAQDELVRTRPDLVRCTDHCRLTPGLEPRTYTEALAALLTERYGVCATSGAPEDEVGVKNDNGWSEQFDVVCCGSEQRVWANKTVICKPARF